MESNSKKVLLVCSTGGHYVQLSLLQAAFSKHDVVWAVSGGSEMLAGSGGYHLTDANKETPVRLVRLVWQVIRVLLRERPGVIVSTGAAPGLIAIVFGGLLGAKTLWIDSVANSARLSLSGRIVRYFADETLTQWQHLAQKGVSYWGAVI